jgi:hypothetical protein
MNSQHIIKRTVAAPSALGVVCALALAACGGGGGAMSSGSTQLTAQSGEQFADTALVSNKTGVVATATTIDANLQNPWGIAVAPGSALLDRRQQQQCFYSLQWNGRPWRPALSQVPTAWGSRFPASAAGVQANPTGQVYNGTGGFLIHYSQWSRRPALFMYDGEGGTIAAWAAQ